MKTTKQSNTLQFSCHDHQSCYRSHFFPNRFSFWIRRLVKQFFRISCQFQFWIFTLFFNSLSFYYIIWSENHYDCCVEQSTILSKKKKKRSLLHKAVCLKPVYLKAIFCCTIMSSINFPFTMAYILIWLKYFVDIFTIRSGPRLIIQPKLRNTLGRFA